jgi:hypothetical protein
VIFALFLIFLTTSAAGQAAADSDSTHSEPLTPYGPPSPPRTSKAEAFERMEEKKVEIEDALTSFSAEGSRGSVLSLEFSQAPLMEVADCEGAKSKPILSLFLGANASAKRITGVLMPQGERYFPAKIRLDLPSTSYNLGYMDGTRLELLVTRSKPSTVGADAFDFVSFTLAANEIPDLSKRTQTAISATVTIFVDLRLEEVLDIDPACVITLKYPKGLLKLAPKSPTRVTTQPKPSRVAPAVATLPSSPKPPTATERPVATKIVSSPTPQPCDCPDVNVQVVRPPATEPATSEPSTTVQVPQTAPAPLSATSMSPPPSSAGKGGCAADSPSSFVGLAFAVWLLSRRERRIC